MPPHRRGGPAATERRLSLARRFSSPLTRRSARFPISIPGAVRKSSRPMSSTYRRLESLGLYNRLDVREGSHVSRNRSRVMLKHNIHSRLLACRRERGLFFFLGLNIPAAIFFTKRRGTRRSPLAPR